MRCLSVLVGLTVTLLSALPASADIIEVGGAAVLAEPPSSILLNQWESDTEIRGFFERQVVLSSDVSLDHVNIGLVDHESLLVPGFVSAGTAVQSYLFHADSVNGFDALLSGYVVFDAPILGVLIHSSSMNGTDGFLGRPGITYGQHPGRRLELPPGSLDTFEISGDRMRLDFTLKFAAANDNIRIITAIPEPGSLALLSLVGLAGLRRRREAQR
ncbi:MAG: PEP-CTERM sorting domain-containing protein [Phycisphaeraceae bacterium]|nr:MAG: PEP-CTERM sorting domain-containing protein [Phycisphaeraceae bacterium]